MIWFNTPVTETVLGKPYLFRGKTVMVDAINISNDLKEPNSISAVSGPEDLLNENKSSRNLSQVLLRESNSYLNESQEKAEKAREYMEVSEDLIKKAAAVRAKASSLRQGKLSKEERIGAVKEIIEMLPDNLKVLVPVNADPEVLDRIADELESRAKEFRTKADDLLKDSERSDKLAKQLIEQANMVSKKELKISDLYLKSASAHNEGLLLVLKKLGVAKLDAEYKEQIAYSQSKAQQG